MARSDLENDVMGALAAFGWRDDAREAGPDGVPAFEAGYGIPFHEKGNGRGRRTILFDGFRSGPRGRWDFLAVKGSDESDRDVPSKVFLTTGTRATIDAIVAACDRGASIPVLVYSRAGWARCFDAAPVIRANRHHVLAAPVKWERGTAPGAYSSAKTRAGGKYKYVSLTLSFTGAGDAAGEWVRADMADLPGMVERAFDWSPAGVSFVY